MLFGISLINSKWDDFVYFSVPFSQLIAFSIFSKSKKKENGKKLHRLIMENNLIFIKETFSYDQKQKISNKIKKSAKECKKYLAKYPQN